MIVEHVFSNEEQQKEIAIIVDGKDVSISINNYLQQTSEIISLNHELLVKLSVALKNITSEQLCK